MNEDAFVSRYLELFSGREEFYAIRLEFPDRAIYMPSDYSGDSEFVGRTVAALTDEIGSIGWGKEAALAHLRGRAFLGVYPLRADSTVSFFALDFDGENPDEAWAEARVQYHTLREEAKLPVVLERSRSGNGYHIWGFFSSPVAAHVVRHALKPWINRATTYDRMFPLQDAVDEENRYGNLIALPLYGPTVKEGKGSFVSVTPEGTPEVIVDQRAFVAHIETIPPERMAALFEAAGAYVPETSHRRPRMEEAGQLSGAGKMTHPILGCEWVAWCWEHPEEVLDPEWYALACQLSMFGEEGREWFHRFSERDPHRYDPAGTDRKFDHATRTNKPHTCRTMRAQLSGPPCQCDQRFPGEVHHPYDLAKISFHRLLQSAVVEEDAIEARFDETFEDVVEHLEAIEKDPTIGRGTPTGIDPLDRVFGFRKGEITLLQARNGSGKTALAVFWMVLLTTVHSVACKLFSMEMTKKQVVQRALSSVTGVSQERMSHGWLTGEDWEKIRGAKETMRGVPFVVDDFTVDLDSQLDAAAEFVFAHAEAIVFVDYLHITQRLPGEDEREMLGRVVQAWKRFAKILDCHVVCLSQLNREADGADKDGATRDSWTRGSDVLNYVTDNNLYLLGEKGPGVVERTLKIQKQRNGVAGVSIPLEFNQTLMQWGPEGTWLSAGLGVLEEEDEDQIPSVGGEEEDDGPFGIFPEL